MAFGPAQFDRDCVTPLILSENLSDEFNMIDHFTNLGDDTFNLDNTNNYFINEDNVSPLLICDSVTQPFSSPTYFTSVPLQPPANVLPTNATLPTYDCSSLINSNSALPFSLDLDASLSSVAVSHEEEAEQSLDTTVVVDSNNNTIDAMGIATYSQKNMKRKEKCMSRNAILARQNREKKKTEMHSLLKRIELEEQEKIAYKKKFNELKQSYDKIVERNLLLESVLQNFLPIYNLVGHFNKFHDGGSSNNSSASNIGTG